MQHAQFEDFAFARNALAIEDVKDRFAKGRGHLVLHHLDARLGTDHLVVFLDRADAADIEAHRGVELERVATGGGFGAAEHDTDFHADLVDENHQRVGAFDVGGELAQGLAHQPGLQAHLRLAHLALDLGLGRERRDRVDDDDVDGTGAHQHVGDLKRLLAVVRLRDQEVVDLDAQLAGVLRIERVLGVDEGRGAAHLLHFGDHLQRERGLTR